MREKNFLNIALSYDLGEGKYNFQSLDQAALKHQPCGPACDLQTTMRSWQALPEFVKQSVSTWVEKTYSVKSTAWALHAAMPVAHNTRTTRKLVQRLVLGTAAIQNTGSVLLVLGVAELSGRSGGSASTSSVSLLPVPNNPFVSASKAATREDVERLQTDLAAMTIELKALRATDPDHVVGADAYMAPIRFKDCVGRKYSFPWHICKTWKGIEGLVNQAFLHVDVIGAYVQQGHYDLMGLDGAIILPQLWDSMVRPDMEISMHMWPIAESPKKQKKAKKPKPEDELYDQNGYPVPENEDVYAAINLQNPFGMDPNTLGADPKAAKKKGKKDKSQASTFGTAPNFDDYLPPPPAPPMASEPRPPKPAVIVELPPGLRETDLEKRVKEVNLDRTRRHSKRAAAQDKTDDRQTRPEVLEIDEDDGFSTQRQDYKLVDWLIHAGADPVDTSRSNTQPRNTGAGLGPGGHLGRSGSTHSNFGPEGVGVSPRTDPPIGDNDDWHTWQDDSDAEDAMLDDEALKNKMLMKYAGGVATTGTSEPLVSGNRYISCIRGGMPC